MRLRFTIRDLLWLILVAALASGWWQDHVRNLGMILDNAAHESRERMMVQQIGELQNQNNHAVTEMDRRLKEAEDKIELYRQHKMPDS
jgi:TolA-binding protein